MMYTVDSKVNVTVTLANIFKFDVPAFNNPYRAITKRIYKFVDADGKVLVWKTTGFLSVAGKIPEPEKGSVVTISGKVKGFSTYKDEDQVELERVKLIEVVVSVEKPVKVAKVVEIKDTDKVWKMTYKNYKMHYADCEIVPGSFVEGTNNTVATVKVIIPEGRVKKSGVRGQRFAGYEFTNELGEKVVYRAVCESNAEKRVNKENPGHIWNCTHVYFYQVHKIW